MKDKLLFNFLMIFLAFTVLLGGIMTAAEIGNYGEEQYVGVINTQTSGSVSVIRRGAGYDMKDNIGLYSLDVIKTGNKAGCLLTVDSQSFMWPDERSEVRLNKCEKGANSVTQLNGTTFISLSLLPGESFEVIAGGASFTLEGRAVIAIEAHAGTQSISVYSGSLKVDFYGETAQMQASELATVITDEDGIYSVAYSKLVADRLSDFLIDKLVENGGLCFEVSTLTEIKKQREDETEAAKAAQAAHEAEILAQGGTVAVINRATPQSGENPNPKDVYTATITIRCDTILDNMQNLKEGKNVYVPNSGVILATSKVEFVKGESVYDVFKRACVYAGIPIEYSWTVQYNGYYIEGINNLYEFDCGKDSGWMYKVNGWYPNYGCSNYILKDGDVIEWHYTCELGRDLGCEWLSN